MWRTFITVPASFKNVPELKKAGKKTKRNLPFPAQIVDGIFERLSILDRCCLALCSKPLLVFASENEYLDYPLNIPPSRRDLQDFFQIRLGQGWIGKGLRYCRCCGKFVITTSLHWRLISEKLTRERSGYIADLWRARRDDGWLRYWIERWCDDELEGRDEAALAIKRTDTTKLVCPRCAILDDRSNAFRKQISGSKPGD